MNRRASKDFIGDREDLHSSPGITSLGIMIYWQLQLETSVASIFH